MNYIPNRWGLCAKVLILFYCMPVVTFIPVAFSDTGEMASLLKVRGCYACHAISEALIGPSYQAIAGLHQERKELMVNVLARKIIVGGAGNWGVVPMVPSEHVTEDEARRMAEWILQQQIEETK